MIYSISLSEALWWNVGCLQTLGLCFYTTSRGDTRLLSSSIQHADPFPVRFIWMALETMDQIVCPGPYRLRRDAEGKHQRQCCIKKVAQHWCASTDMGCQSRVHFVRVTTVKVSSPFDEEQNKEDQRQDRDNDFFLLCFVLYVKC